MSITICYRPISDKPKHFSGGTSDAYDVLKQTFGSQITENDINKLRAMSLASRNKFYDEVADVIENIGSIEFFGEY